MNNSPLKSKQKLSRQESLRRNPVGWIILLGIVIVFIAMSVFPSFGEWRTKRENIKRLLSENQILEQEVRVKKIESEAKELEFTTLAAPFIGTEKQLFPVSIDIRKITKLLEVFALQLENLDSQSHNSRFDLTKIGFGQTKREKGEPYSSTTLSLNFITDRENLVEFVHFLQTGELSERLKQGKERKQIQLVDYKFLEDNLLPVAHIDSIKSSEQKDDGLLNTQIQLRLFSQ
ncbi:hypothetical protein K9L63_03775 [Candidatus Gracilibacteria bacterium]|nr:hypothetical protein [Candidatus Gracilibacteria bacterium]